MGTPLDFDAAYRRKRFEEVREKVKRGELDGFAAGLAGMMTAVELDVRRNKAKAHADKLWFDLCVHGPCVRDEDGHHVPLPRFFGLDLAIDASVPDNEIHLVEPTGVRHRITNIEID